MWIMSQNGFLSAVEDWDDPSVFRVRARDRKSLESMLRLLKENGENIDGLKIVTGAGTDYRWRVLLPRDLFTTYLVAEAQGIDYGNFKDQVTVTRGHKWHDAFLDVWYAMLAVDDGKKIKGRSWDLAGRAVKR
jgi:hypothetical protein